MYIYIYFFIKFNFSFYNFARPHKMQSFNFNRAEIKAVCLSVRLSVYLYVFNCSKAARKVVEICIATT